ncbi:MAG: arsenate reductase ArsC [Methanotrichaceae archaeon]|nr:arsenate reductase ArsC [Methanotrichaceae archaeon]
MAEGFLRAMYGDRHEAYSAGVKATSVDHAIKVMIGRIYRAIVQIVQKNFTVLSLILLLQYVIMIRPKKTMCPLCGTTIQPIPDAPIAKTIIHKGIFDPADVIGSEDEKLAILRKVRDEIKSWITQIFRVKL